MNDAFKTLAAASQGGDDYELIAQRDIDREDWWTKRRTGIGASEAAVIMGCSTYMTELELYESKTTAALLDDDAAPDVPENDPEYMEWGNILEPIIAKAYGSKRYADRPVLSCAGNPMYRSKKHPHLLATLDSLQLHEQFGVGPLECKATAGYMSWRWADGAPEPFFWQVVQQCITIGAEAGAIAALIGGNRLVHETIVPTEMDCAHYAARAEGWWSHHVLKDIPPNPTGTDADQRAIARLYPSEVEGREIELDGALLDTYYELQARKAEARDLDERTKLLQNKLRMAMGDAEVGWFPNKHSLTFRSQTRKPTTTKGSTFRVLRLRDAKMPKTNEEE